MKLDKEGILASVARAIDAANAMERAPDHHFIAGGGPTIPECQWFICIAVAGSPVGETFREKIARDHATQEHYRRDQRGGVDARESSSEPFQDEETP